MVLSGRMSRCYICATRRMMILIPDQLEPGFSNGRHACVCEPGKRWSAWVHTDTSSTSLFIPLDFVSSWNTKGSACSKLISNRISTWYDLPSVGSIEPWWKGPSIYSSFETLKASSSSCGLPMGREAFMLLLISFAAANTSKVSPLM